MWKRRHCAWLIFLLAGAPGCRTAAPLPKMNLSQPGWSVRQGQAVWHVRRSGPEIAGELLAATRGGESFVQFSKNPFVFAVAQAAGGRWQIEFPPKNKKFSGRGRPPAQIVWFQLARALSGQPPARGWSWKRLPGGNWRLANPATGESLAGYFSQ